MSTCLKWVSPGRRIELLVSTSGVAHHLPIVVRAREGETWHASDCARLPLWDVSARRRDPARVGGVESHTSAGRRCRPAPVRVHGNGRQCQSARSKSSAATKSNPSVEMYTAFIKPA